MIGKTNNLKFWEQ